MSTKIEPYSKMYRGEITPKHDLAVSVKLVCYLGYGGEFRIYRGNTDQTDDEVLRHGAHMTINQTRQVGDALFANFIHGRYADS